MDKQFKKVNPSCASCGHLTDNRCDIHNSNLMYPDEDHGCSYWQPKSAISVARCSSCKGFEFTTPDRSWGRCNQNPEIQKEIHGNWFACEQMSLEQKNCPYFKGTARDGRRPLIKCGDKVQLMCFGEDVAARDQEVNDHCCGDFNFCRPYLFRELEKAGTEPRSSHTIEELHEMYLQIKGADEVAKQTYYTKCGREFEKSTNAETTGYFIAQDENKIRDIKCADCPFPVEVTDGWPDKKHVRWECRAGSKVPNHTTDWQGSTEDKLTIQVRSLDHAFLESVLEYCKTDPELGGSYISDLSDCRRQISVACSSNKKGIAAKKALIEKFFPAVEAIPDDDQSCCENCNWSEDYGESVEYIKCAESGKRKDVKKKQAACANYVPSNVICNEPEGDFEEQLDELLKEGDKVDKDENACPYGKLSCDCPAIGFQGDCQVIRRKDWDRYYFVKEMQKYNIDCEEYKTLAAEIIAEKKPNKAEIAIKTDENVTETVSFDYATLDIETAEFLQDKADKISTIRMKSVMAIGKELKEVHDKLANNKNGVFGAWCESIGVSRRSAELYIQGFDYIAKNFRNIDEADQIQPSLLFAISKPSAPAELQKAVLSGDIKTNKDYQEAMTELKAAKETIGDLTEKLKKAPNSDEVARLKSTVIEQVDKLETAQDEIDELNQQLNSKPIEVQATTIKEVVPADVQAELQRLTTENRLLSEQQTSASKTIESIVQSYTRVSAELNAYILLAKHEVPNLKEIPNSVKDTIYKSISALKVSVLDLEGITKHFRSEGNG